MARFPGYAPAFPNRPPSNAMTGRDGSTAAWLGGDGAASCPLDGARSVWVFSDTYVGPAGATARRGGWAGGVIGNTVGLGVCRAGGFSVDYFHGGADGSVRPFFDDDVNAAFDARFWAMKALTIGTALYVLLVRARNASPHAGTAGCAVARVANPHDPPPAWRVEYLTLTSGPKSLLTPTLGCEAFATGTDLVLYGSAAGRTVVAAVPLRALAQAPAGSDLAAEGCRYLAADGVWKPGLGGADARDCKIPSTAGYSVRRAGTALGWLCAYTDTRAGGGFPPCVSAMTAPGPFGPWGEPRVAGYFPEMAPGNPAYDADNACYAVREVPDFATDPTRCVVTYTVGSRTALLTDETSRQLRDPAVYAVKSAAFRNPFL